MLNFVHAKITACGDRTRDQRIKSPTLYLTELTRHMVYEFKFLSITEYIHFTTFQICVLWMCVFFRLCIILMCTFFRFVYFLDLCIPYSCIFLGCMYFFLFFVSFRFLYFLGFCIFYISIFFRFSHVNTTRYDYSILLLYITTCLQNVHNIQNTHDPIFIIYNVYWLETTQGIKYMKYNRKISKCNFRSCDIQVLSIPRYTSIPKQYFLNSETDFNQFFILCTRIK